MAEYIVFQKPDLSRGVSVSEVLKHGKGGVDATIHGSSDSLDAALGQRINYKIEVCP